MEPKPTEKGQSFTVTLEMPAMTLEIDGKIYNVTFSDAGIFIQSDDGVEITEKSQTGNWLIIK